MNIGFFIPPRFLGKPGSSINKEFISALKKLKLDYIKLIQTLTKINKREQKEQNDKIYKEIMKQVNLGLEYMELLDTIIITDIDFSKINDNHITKESLKIKIQTIRNKIPGIRIQLIAFLRFLSEIYNSWPTHDIKKKYYDLYT